MNEPTNTHEDPIVKHVDSEVLLDIWLDGFSSGMATLILNASEGHDDAPPEMVQDAMVQRIVGEIMSDPAAMETARQKIFARVLGAPQFGTIKLDLARVDPDKS